MKTPLRVEPFEIDRYLVASGSRREIKHLVDLNHEGEEKCSCEDFEFSDPAQHPYRCKHIVAVLAFIEAAKEQVPA